MCRICLYNLVNTLSCCITWKRIRFISVSCTGCPPFAWLSSAMACQVNMVNGPQHHTPSPKGKDLADHPRHMIVARGLAFFESIQKRTGFNSPRSPALQEPRGEMIWQCPVRVHWLRSCLVDWHSVMVAESRPTCAHSNYFRLRETVGFSSVFFGVAELTIEYSRIRMNLAPILCFLFSCLSSSSSSLSALPFYAFFIPLIFIFEVTSSAFGILLVSVLLFQISIVIVIVMTCEQEAKLSV